MSSAHRWFPAQPPVPVREKLLAGLSAFVCIALLWGFNNPDPGSQGNNLLASMGATAVLLFAIPHSTLVQPSAILGGHILSALVGVACHQLIPAVAFAAATAVGLSIILMHLLHCLHPPGGATALFAVVGGEPVWNLGYAYVITPVASNAVLMLLLGLILNNLGRPGKKYPAPAAPPPATPKTSLLPGPTHADIAQALRTSGTYLDITESDLLEVFQAAELRAAGRFLANQRAGDLLSGSVETLRYGDSLDTVWRALSRSTQGCVVIVDAFSHVEGIITLADILRTLVRETHPAPLERVTKLLRPGRHERPDNRVAGQIMTHPVITADENASADEIARMLANGDFHHVPILNARRRLVGVITHADLWTLIRNGK